MKIIMSLLVLLPAAAMAGGADQHSTAMGPCRFSVKAQTKFQIVHKDRNECGEKLCNHTLVCQEKYLKIVNCKAKNGQCTGYTADECYAAAQTTSLDAEYDTGTN